jgi:hypothetical protein
VPEKSLCADRIDLQNDFAGIRPLRDNPAQHRAQPAWQQFHPRPGSALLRRIIGVTGFSPAAVNRGGK